MAQQSVETFGHAFDCLAKSIKLFDISLNLIAC